MLFKLKKNSGISLVEILVVFGIIAIVSAISFAAFSGLKTDRILQKESSKLVSALEEARSMTVSGKGASNYGIFVETLNNRGVLFKGDSFDVNNPINQEKEIIFDDAVFISAVSLADSGDSVIFKRLKGETDQYGSITLALTEASTTQKTVAIYPTGTIEEID